MTQWTARPRFLALLPALVLLGSCGTGGDSDVPAAASSATASEAESASPSPREEAATSSPTPTASPTTSPTDAATTAAPTPTEEPVAAAPPTPRQVWAASYETNQAPYVAAVAAALALAPAAIDPEKGYRNTCRLLGKQRALDQRVSKVRSSFGLAGRPTYDQSLAALDTTATTICPEFAAFHQAQTAERVEALRVAEEQRKERERKAKQRAAQAAKAKAQQEQEQANVYYANCTEVENAGAAPIYTGDPGYSGDLDRDGDGVACEQ